MYLKTNKYPRRKNKQRVRYEFVRTIRNGLASRLPKTKNRRRMKRRKRMVEENEKRQQEEQEDGWTTFDIRIQCWEKITKLLLFMYDTW